MRGVSPWHEKFICIFWGRRMSRSWRHMNKWVFGLGSFQQLSRPLGLVGNVLIMALGRGLWWPSHEDIVIDEGIAQLLCWVLVNIVLLVKGELPSRLGLLSFSLHFSLNTDPTLGKVCLPQTIYPTLLGYFSWMAAPTPSLRPGSWCTHTAQSIQHSTHCLAQTKYSLNISSFQ